MPAAWIGEDALVSKRFPLGAAYDALIRLCHILIGFAAQYPLSLNRRIERTIYLRACSAPSFLISFCAKKNVHEATDKENLSTLDVVMRGEKMNDISCEHARRYLYCTRHPADHYQKAKHCMTQVGGVFAEILKGCSFSIANRLFISTSIENLVLLCSSH